MKTFLGLALLLISTLTFADSVNFKVKSFKGELKVDEADFKITSMKLVARNQFCNFWGTTCAGGPNEIVEVPVQFRVNNNTNLISFNADEVKVKTSKFSNRFSSCNLDLKIAGEQSNGKKLYGNVELIFENDKSVCESEEAIAEEIANILKVPALVQLIPYNW